MDSGTVSLVIGILTFLSGVFALIASRRTRKADESHTLAGTIEKLASNISSLQTDNQKYYEENLKLKTAKEKLEERLSDRDVQVRTMAEQLERLQSREKQMQDLQDLTAQLQTTLQVAEAQKVIIEDQGKAITILKAKTAPLPPLDTRRD